MSAADRIFGTECDADRPPQGEQKYCHVELLPYYKVQWEPGLQYSKRWNLALTYDASGTIVSFALTNTNLKG